MSNLCLQKEEECGANAGSGKDTYKHVLYFLFSFFSLHFLRHCGSSSSSSLCRFTPLVLLLLPSRVLVLRLWFFLLVAPNPLLLALSYLFFVHCVATPSLLLLFWMNDCIVLDVVNIGLMLLFEECRRQKWYLFEKISYGSVICMNHTDQQSIWVFLLNNFFF